MLANARVGAILPVVDLDRARKFYEETLGLQPFMQTDDGVTYCVWS